MADMIIKNQAEFLYFSSIPNHQTKSEFTHSEYLLNLVSSQSSYINRTQTRNKSLFGNNLHENLLRMQRFVKYIRENM